MFPYLNPEVKVAFRWYAKEERRNRHLKNCSPDSKVCPFALDFPPGTILPFQLRSPSDQIPIAWRITDLAGSVVLDITAQIGGALFISGRTEPLRYLLTMPSPLMLLQALEAGTYEMELEWEDGSMRYSETFKHQCGTCVVAAGVYGVDFIAEGSVYLYTEGRYATYCGLGCSDPVDSNGFNTVRACDGYAIAYTTLGGSAAYRYLKWSGTAWAVETELMPCHHLLTWGSCGDIGSVAYYGSGLVNQLYIEEGESFIGDPLPIIKAEVEATEGDKDITLSTRKDVDWTLQPPPVPAYLADALSEIQLLEDVELRVAGSDGSDTIDQVRVAITWNSDKCLANAVVTFRVDEGAVGTGCCEAPTLPCEGEGYGSFTATEAALLLISTTSGYLTLRNLETQEIQVYGDGLPNPTIVIVDLIGSFCMWSSDAFGNPSGIMGDFTVIDGIVTDIIFDGYSGLYSLLLSPDSAAILDSIDLSWHPLLNQFSAPGSGLTTLDLSTNNQLFNDVTLIFSTNLVTVLAPTVECLYYVDFRDCALSQTSVHQLIMACNASATGGSLLIDGGTNAAPPAVEDLAKIALLIAASWTVSTN